MGCFKLKGQKEEELTRFSDKKKLSVSKKVFVKQRKCKVSDHYEVLKEIGDGSYGKVFQVNHIHSKTKRAMKSIPLSQTIDLDQLMIEVNVLKELDHPNIVRIFEVINDSKFLNIVMEQCTGGELYERIKKSSHFSESLASQYMFDIVSAIKYCHEAKLVHRDLKPENVLFESSKKDARLKIIDFGTSKYFKPNEKMQKFIGTSYYVAPEVIDKNYDEKCDVWSLGIMLYAMLCGFPPFLGETNEEIFGKIKNNKVSFKSENWKCVSKEVKSLIRRMLIKDPIKRPTIHEIYLDPWIQNKKSKVSDMPIAGKTLENMHNFQVECNLKKITMSYIVSQLIVSEEVNDLREIFHSLDKNGDGKLSKEELLEGFQEGSGIIGFNIDKIFQECDADGNGYVDYTEFLVAASNWQNLASKERLKAAFKAYDQDGNGRISPQELVNALKSSGIEKKIIKDMIEAADTNGDGEMDFDEFEHIMLKVGNRA